jgi:hypothetical protein
MRAAILAAPMQLSRATALIAVLLIIVLAAGYAGAEHEATERAAAGALTAQR